MTVTDSEQNWLTFKTIGEIVSVTIYVFIFIYYFSAQCYILIHFLYFTYFLSAKGEVFKPGPWV